MIAGALLLGACAGGGANASTPATAAVPTASHATAPVRLTFVVPKPATSAKARRAQYVSTSTTSLTITVTPASGIAQSPIYVACTATCSANFQAPIGSDTIALKLTDGVNGGGDQLSLSTTTVLVVANASNQFNLTANPVVSSVAVEIGSVPASSASTNAGTAADIPVTINAEDAAGNTIIGPGSYVDANDVPVTITLSVADTQSGGSGDVTLSQTTFTAPPTTSVTAHYNAGWMDHATITAASSSSAVSIAGSATLATTPTYYEYPGGSGNAFADLVTGPDGEIWFNEPSANAIGKITTAGTVTEYSNGISGSTSAVAAGPDGNIWFTESGTNTIGRITPGGSVTEFPVTTAASSPSGITAGPDGNLWFTETAADQIGKITPTGAITEYPVPLAGSGPTSIVAGPDGNLWFTWVAGYCAIGKATTAGTISMFGSSCFVPNQIISAPDGTLWAPSFGNPYADVISVSGAQSYPDIDYATTGLTSGVDGNIWAGARAADTIVRVTTAGVSTAYPLGENPWGLTTGPDGNIWYSGWGSNTIGKFVY